MQSPAAASLASGALATPAPIRRWRAMLERARPWALLAACAAIGLGGRVWILLHSLGSNDIVYWKDFAGNIQKHGVAWMYQHVAIYNHPPLPGYFAAVMLWAEKALRLRFEVGFKLLALFADALSAVVLYRLWRAHGRDRAVRAAALYALSLAAILIASHHGNTDAAVAALVLLAAHLFDRKRLFVAGLALGAALNVKLVPALLLPLFLLQCRTWREFGAFVGALAIASVPFLPFLVTSGPAFVHNALAYNSDPRRWGLYALLDMLRETRHLIKEGREVVPLYREYGRYAILTLVAALAVVARVRPRWSMVELATLGTIVFLALAPGFGVQYVEYAVPLLLAVRLGRGYAYSTAAGLFLLVNYVHFWTGKTPWYSFFEGTYLPTLGVCLGLVCWTLLVHTGVRVLLWPRASDGAG
jgi:hypothetical protein